MQSDEQAIRELIQTWLEATSSGDLERVLSLMSDDVIFHTPGRVPFGKKEFAASTRASQGKVRVEGKADVKEVQVSGDLAFCRIHLAVTLRTPEGAEVKRLSGYSMSFLRKHGGRWAVFRDANFVVPVKPDQTVTTQLMFDGRAEEAMRLYVSLFKGSEVKQVVKYGPGEQGKEGTVKRAEFTIAGHRLACIDSPMKHAFGFTPSISLFVECGSETEFDRAFAELSSGGVVLMPPNNYGFSAKFAWINDCFGVSWQLNVK